MKRRISITMGLSLVAVFAIIATLGLMSLNQPAPVYAAVPGGSTVGDAGGPMLELEFNAPASGLTSGDSIIVRTPNFNTSGASRNAADYTFTGFGAMAPTQSSSGSAGAALTFPIGADVAAGTALSIRIDSGAGVLAPLAEGMYYVTVDIDKTGTAADISSVASMTVHVQNPVTFGPARLSGTPPVTIVTASHATITTSANRKEDIASGEIMVEFRSGANDDALSVDDNDTITIQLENFQIPSGLSDGEVTVMDNTNSTPVAPAGVSVSGDMVELMVPDMQPNQLQTQTIAQGATVTVTFKATAGIMNPTNGGGHSVKVHTSASSKPAEQMICYDMATSAYTALTGTPPMCTSPAMMVPVGA